MVILMIAVGMSVLVALSDSTYVAMRLNSAAERRVKAEYVLKSAINVALVLIENDKNAQDDPLTDDWMKFTQGLEAPGTLIGLDDPNVRVTLLIASEQGKIPLLRLKDTGTAGNPSPNIVTWAPVLLRLLQNVAASAPTGNTPPVAPEQLVANLIDYIDVNEDNFSYQNFQGSESGLPDNQKLRNEGKLESLASELSAVPGFTSDIVQRILPYVSASDFQKINLNSAPEQVLMALDSGITQSLAAQIIQARDPQGGSPFTSAFSTELAALVGGTIEKAVNDKVTASGNIFEVIAKVEYGQQSTFMASATINKSPKGGGGGPRIESLLIY